MCSFRMLYTNGWSTFSRNESTVRGMAAAHSPAMLDISTSIIQGSAVGPVSYVINTGDLATVVQGNRIHKYADDTYIIIPASNVQHREAELEHVAQWAQANDLKLNRTKSVEVIFSSRRKPQECHPPELLDICRVTTITILGVTWTNHFSISEHVTDIISKCAQSLYALKVLRCRGMGDDALMIIFRSVVLAKILYASPAWWGFANSSDKQRLEAFMRRCIRLNFYRQDDSTVDHLVADLDDGLFAAVLLNDQHVLRCILPERNTHSYSLRPRRHELVLTTKRDSRNFLERQ